jgi:predicted nucleic acid-binding protein
MAAKAVIFDSNVWIAYFHTKDSQHSQAVTELQKYQSATIILTEYVLLEIATLLKQKIGQAKARAIIGALVQTENIEVLPSVAFFSETLGSFLSKDDKHLSFTDLSLLHLSKKTPIITYDKKLAAAIKKASSHK